MPTRLPKADYDRNAWITLNNYFNALNEIEENIDIIANGNNPPTIKQYTRFQYYKTDTGYTISNSYITGNNEYSAGSNITYLINEAIYENGSDVTFTWGGTVRGVTFPSISNTTWYIYCQGSYDNNSSSVGQGKYKVTTNAPTYDNTKAGFWHATDGKCIGRFLVSGSTVSDVTSISRNKQEMGIFTGKGVYTDTSIKIYPYKINCNGNTFYNAAGVTIQAISGLTASTWYAVVMNENTGVISVVSASSGWTNWTISGNKLNLMSIYDTKLNYCRDSRSGIYYRILAVGITNSTPNGMTYLFNLQNRPKTNIYIARSTNQTITTSSHTKVQLATVHYDLLSEFDATTNYRFSPIGAKNLMISAFSTGTATGWSAGEELIYELYKNGTLEIYIGNTVTQTTYNGKLTTFGTLINQGYSDNSYIEFYMWQNSGGDFTLTSSVIGITEV